MTVRRRVIAYLFDSVELNRLRLASRRRSRVGLRYGQCWHEAKKRAEAGGTCRRRARKYVIQPHGSKCVPNVSR